MAFASLISLALAAGASAARMPREPTQQLASYPLTVAQRQGWITGRDVDITLYNQTVVTYLFEVDIGTPPQKVQVVLDTGSFELWVDPTCSAASTTDQAQSCQAAGIYDPDKSSTFTDMNATNELPYGKGTVDVAYVADSLLVPGLGAATTMKDVVFGVGQQSKDLAFGIAGVGHGKGYNLEYSNLIDQLYAQNVTQSKAFSVALGSKDSSNGGTVVFGGVDTKKFSGKLASFLNLPPQPEGDQAKGLYRYWVQLDSVGITKPGASGSTAYANTALPVVLDTGATISYLPQAIIDKLAIDMSAQVLNDGSLAVACSLLTQAGTVDFTFGNMTIKVPYHDFIWEIAKDTCIAGAAPVGATTPILGDSFLRSAYVVFDQTNNNIFLGQYKNCGTNEKTLPAAAGAAGNFTGECDATSGKQNGAVGREMGNVWLVVSLMVGIQAIFLSL